MSEDTVTEVYEKIVKLLRELDDQVNLLEKFKLFSVSKNFEWNVYFSNRAEIKVKLNVKPDKKAWKKAQDFTKAKTLYEFINK